MTELGFPPRLRLLNKAAFSRVFDSADLKVSESSLLILARSNSLQHPRIGFVISKKNVRRAVNRNRVRRIIRESFRLNQHKLPSYDLVILARRGIDEIENEQLAKMVGRCWKRLTKKAEKAKQSL